MFSIPHGYCHSLYATDPDGLRLEFVVDSPEVETINAVQLRTAHDSLNDMVVDHGFVQIWEAMYGGFDQLPIIPIFVNAIGYPLPKYRRARLLGEAVGRFAQSSGKRVLFDASGGLSHDPIVAKIRGATPEVRDRLTGRTSLKPEQQAARERAVYAAGEAAMRGEGPSRPLNPTWVARSSRCWRNGTGPPLTR